MKKKVLGVSVDMVDRKEALLTIELWLLARHQVLRMVVTAYSEFFVKAVNDKYFFEILNKADLVVPDGVSVLAAVDYSKRAKPHDLVNNFWQGLVTGKKILNGQLGETVTGVWLFEELISLASRKAWKVFLLGGWDDVSAKATKKISELYPDLRVEFDGGERRVGDDSKTNDRVVEKINRFKPDLLFVSYNPVKQEKWIAENKSRLKAGVAIGVGGTFNEFVGDLRLAPKWMQRMGLKWFWRLILEPARWRRIYDAVIVFPWLVFVASIKGKS